MGSNRGRKARGGSQDFGAGLKYNSRLEVGEGWGPGTGRSQSGSARTVACTGALGFARAPLYGSWVAGARVHRWNFLFGGCLAAGDRAGPVGPRPSRRREALGPGGVGGSPPASCPPFFRWLEKGPPMGVPIALGYQCFEWVTWAMARTSWRLVCPWPLQKLVLLFLVKGSLDLL